MRVVVHDGEGEVVVRDGAVVLFERADYRVVAPPTARVALGARILVYDDAIGGYPLSTRHAVGAQRLTVEHGDARTELQVRVRPHPDKLTDAGWLAMVQDLEAWLPGVTVGMEGLRDGAVGRRGAAAPLLVEALTPLLPKLERAVHLLLSRPRERAVPVRDDVPLRRVRRVDRETVAWLGRHPAAAAWLGTTHDLPTDAAHQVVPHPGAVDTVDHPANRYVAWLLDRVIRTLREVAGTLRSASHRHDDLNDTRAWATARAARLDAGADALSRRLARSFLRRLRPRPATEAALQVVVDDPAYARVHQLCRRFLSPRFALDGDDPGAAVRPSFEVYELWAFLAVRRALADALGDRWCWRGVRLDRLLDPASTGGGAGYEATGPEGTLTLLFNARFGGWHQARSHPRHAVSAERRPDLVVGFRPTDGDGRWLCLDAKYRAGRPALGDALTSAHLYRDALRWTDHGGRCVAAWLLAPARSEDCLDWYDDRFMAEHGVGIVAVTPGLATDVGERVLGVLGVI